MKLSATQQKAMQTINNHKRILNKQTHTALKGQILSGDPKGALKGLTTIVEKRKKRFQEE